MSTNYATGLTMHTLTEQEAGSLKRGPGGKCAPPCAVGVPEIPARHRWRRATLWRHAAQMRQTCAVLLDELRHWVRKTGRR